MKKNISWQVLILLGVVGIVISRVASGVIIDSIGVLGDLLFLLGVVNLISALVKRKKNTNVADPTMKKFMGSNHFFDGILVLMIIGISVWFWLDHYSLQKRNDTQAASIADYQMHIADKTARANDLQTCLDKAGSDNTYLWSINGTKNLDGSYAVSNNNIRDWLENKYQNNKNDCFKQFPQN
jgi:hypothetical protein